MIHAPLTSNITRTNALAFSVFLLRQSGAVEAVGLAVSLSLDPEVIGLKSSSHDAPTISVLRDSSSERF